jgi:hypothetical protein
MANEQHQSGLLTTPEAAAFLRVAEGTLRQWRATGRVRLSYSKYGSQVRYMLSDLIKFVQEHRHEAQ